MYISNSSEEQWNSIQRNPIPPVTQRNSLFHTRGDNNLETDTPKTISDLNFGNSEANLCTSFANQNSINPGGGAVFQTCAPERQENQCRITESKQAFQLPTPKQECPDRNQISSPGVARSETSQEGPNRMECQVSRPAHLALFTGVPSRPPSEAKASNNRDPKREFEEHLVPMFV